MSVNNLNAISINCIIKVSDTKLEINCTNAGNDGLPVEKMNGTWMK